MEASAVDGIMVASPVQAYVDLKRLGGQGDDAAEAILDQVLRPKWRMKA